MNVTEAGKKECEESKIMWVLIIICSLFTIQYNKNIQSEGQGHMIEHTDLNTET